MTYYVNQACVMCKHTDCVEVCPVDCFYEGENFLAINPDECIDCGVCETSGPNRWPVLTKMIEALETAEEYATKTDKMSLLSEKPGPGDEGR